MEMLPLLGRVLPRAPSSPRDLIVHKDGKNLMNFTSTKALQIYSHVTAGSKFHDPLKLTHHMK